MFSFEKRTKPAKKRPTLKTETNYLDTSFHKKIPSVSIGNNKNCAQLFAPSGITPYFDSKHMFRDVAVGGLTYDGTTFKSSTLVKLPGGSRDLVNLYEAATPRITTSGTIDFEVPTVEYNGEAVSNSSAVANRFLQFNTNDLGKICHLENPKSTSPNNTYAKLQALLPGIRENRKSPLAVPDKREIDKTKFNETLYEWIKNLTCKDTQTLEGHPKEALLLNKILSDTLDVYDFSQSIVTRLFECVPDEYIDDSVKKPMKSTALSAMITQRIKVLYKMKLSITRDQESEATSDSGYDYANSAVEPLIKELQGKQVALTSLIEQIKSYELDDLAKWIEDGFTPDQLGYIKKGINYSKSYL